MFTKGFKKQADAPPIMPTVQQGKAFKKGLEGGGPTFGQALTNIKNEVGNIFGMSATNTGKMNQ